MRFTVSSVLVAALSLTAVRIMALGDSITGSPGCWRAFLWQKLQQANIKNTDFVGTLPGQGCGFTYDGENEGHGGYTATKIADENLLPGWLSATQPDIVMMHLGTNDVWSNISPQNILIKFSKLVDQMRASKPTMKILVAQIIPMNPSGCAACGSRVVALNAEIAKWAVTKNSTASPIQVVDVWTGFDVASMTGDGVHPNAAGTQQLATKWYPAVAKAITG
ncbi:SGNH hydrolase-type esterase domain-containing protein [Paraphoma chrysanthemicola]|uniref:SGNH hydrolase-type esterase domain-containing protein n=1 Tax=Paraphoma chrysanthemicola TaxID=798071 RepID=A0A8K0R9L9_9PLEO|nr:SGNH hydrolase-type esterase domain-containing protein [Paraphoma chrysanthemicola]